MTRTCFVHTQNSVVRLRMLRHPANLSLNQNLRIWGQTSSFLQAPLIPKQPGAGRVEGMCSVWCSISHWAVNELCLHSLQPWLCSMGSPGHIWLSLRAAATRWFWNELPLAFCVPRAILGDKDAPCPLKYWHQTVLVFFFSLELFLHACFRECRHIYLIWVI